MPKVYKEESGRYVLKTYETYKGIKFICRGTSRTNKAEAKENWKKNLEARKNKIDYVSTDSTIILPLKIALPKWYKLYHEQSWRNERTKFTDYDTINQICNSILGELPVNLINSDHIQKYLITEAKTHSKSSLKKRKCMLNMFFTQYRTNDNPIRKIELPTPEVKSKDLTAYSDEDISKLTEILSLKYNPMIHRNTETSHRGYVYGHALLVCLYEYLRYSELTELRVKDVHFDEGLIYVSRQYDEYTGEVKPPKYNSVREVPIAKEVWDIIVEACKDKSPDQLIFPSGALNASQQALDHHIRGNNLRSCLYSAEEYLHLSRHTVHDLRHDGISMWVRRGLLPQDVSRFAGHKSVSFTLEKYYRQTKMINVSVIESICGKPLK